MTLLHGRQRRRIHLLAAGALAGAEREAAERHAGACPACRADLDELRVVLALLARDPLRQVEPPPFAALRARVNARLDAAARGEAPVAGSSPAGWLRPAAVAAAAALALLTLVRSPQPPGSARDSTAGRVPTTAPAADAGGGLLLPPDSLRRLERRLARAQAARYLNEAQDVLVNVAATLPRCTRRARRVEVAAEARRSRELLARRALMVELGAPHVASAGGVLHDVERALREVAAFDDCESRGRVEALSQELDQRRLLLRMALVGRELQG